MQSGYRKTSTSAKELSTSWLHKRGKQERLRFGFTRVVGKKKLNEERLGAIRKLIEEQNDFTINEIRDALHLTASYSTVERAVRSMGFRLKKKTLHASERDRHRCGGKA